MLGDKVRGFDRDFLRAWRRDPLPERLVLGEVLSGDQPIRPSQGQRIAVASSRISAPSIPIPTVTIRFAACR